MGESWPAGVPETLWNYSLLTMQEPPQLPMMGVKVAPAFLYSFAVGGGFVAYFAWDRFNKRKPNATSFGFQVMKELEVAHLGGAGALRRAYLLYLLTLLAIYVSMTFFGELVIQTLNGLNLAGLQVDASSLKFDSPQWPLMLAFGIAGLAPLVPPLQAAEEWLFSRAYRAVGIPVRINQTTRNLIDILDNHSAAGDDPLAAELVHIRSKLASRLEGTSTDAILKRSGKEEEASSILSELMLLVSWARGGRGTWPGPEVSEEVRHFERQVADKADALLQSFFDRLEAEAASGQKSLVAMAAAEQREQARRKERLMTTLQDARTLRDELLAILAIYAERDPTYVGTQPDENGSGDPAEVALSAGRTTVRPSLRRLLAEAEQPNLAGDGPETGLLLCMIPVALLYAAFTWQGQHPVVSPTANRETWQAVAATAGIETLRVMATLWLPLLAAFAVRQYFHDRRDWIVHPSEDSSTWTEQRILTLGLAVAVAVIGLLGVALLTAFMIAPSVSRFQDILVHGRTPLVLYLPSYAIVTLPVVHFAIKAADRRAAGRSGSSLGFWCAVCVVAVLAAHLAVWYGANRACSEFGTFLLDMFSPGCALHYGSLDFAVYPVLAFMAVAVFGNPSSVTAAQRRINLVSSRGPQVAALAGALVLAVPGPRAQAVDIYVGFRADAEPFSYLVDSDKAVPSLKGHQQHYAGFIADLCYYIFEQPHQSVFEIKEVPIDTANRFHKLKQPVAEGGIDILCDPVTMRFSDPDRNDIGLFSPIVFASGITYLKRRDHAPRSAVYIAYLENTTTKDVLRHSCMVDLFRVVARDQRHNLAIMCETADIARELDKIRTTKDSTDQWPALSEQLIRLAKVAEREKQAAEESKGKARDWQKKTFEPMIEHWKDIAARSKAFVANDQPGLGSDANACRNDVANCARDFDRDLGFSCEALDLPPEADPSMPSQATAAPATVDDAAAWTEENQEHPLAKQTVYRFCPMRGHAEAIEWFCERRFGANANKGLVYLGDRDIILGKLRTWNSRHERCTVENENGADDLTYEPYALLVSDNAPRLPELMRLVQRRVYEFFSFQRQAEAAFDTYFPRELGMSPLLAYLFLLNGVEEERLLANPTEGADPTHADPESEQEPLPPQVDPAPQVGFVQTGPAPLPRAAR